MTSYQPRKYMHLLKYTRILNFMSSVNSSKICYRFDSVKPICGHHFCKRRKKWQHCCIPNSMLSSNSGAIFQEQRLDCAINTDRKLPAGKSKSFSVKVSCLTTLLLVTPILKLSLMDLVTDNCRKLPNFGQFFNGFWIFPIFQM